MSSGAFTALQPELNVAPASHHDAQDSIRVYCCNVLYEEYYRRHNKNATNTVPHDVRLALFVASAPQIRRCDVVCLQEFPIADASWRAAWDQGDFYVHASSNHGAGVVVAMKKGVFHEPMFEVVPLDRGGKALVLASAVHIATHQRVLIVGGHLPWQRDPAVRRRLMASLLPSHETLPKFPNTIMMGDFNFEWPVFDEAASSSSDGPGIAKWTNCVATLPFTSLFGSCKGTCAIDHVWLRSAHGALRCVGATMVPSDPGALIFHEPSTLETTTESSRKHFSDHVAIEVTLAVEPIASSHEDEEDPMAAADDAFRSIVQAMMVSAM